jgi:hypothetical protein
MQPDGETRSRLEEVGARIVRVSSEVYQDSSSMF